MTQIRMRSTVAWLPWGSAAFARARDEGKALLLSISAPWSAACREMDRACYEDGEIADEINRWFVPVRVDADRRPDVAERYELGGLPSTVFLNADGAMLGGGTFVPPDRLRDAMRRLRQVPVTAQPPSPPLQHATAAPVAAERLIESIYSSYDAEHGGFRATPKFPLTPPLHLALDLFRETQSAEMVECVTRSLDAMGWSSLYDEEHGGFRRCAAGADWSDPQPEKLLVANAALLDLYLEAGTTLGNERWLGRAADIVEFLQGRLAIGPGEGWRLSEQSDATRFSDATAVTVSALLRASTVFQDTSLRDLAIESLEAVVLATYRPGQGVAHCQGGVRGLLTDHVAMISAHLDAWDLTEDVVYQMMAQELAHYAVRTMASETGGFVDRAFERSDDDIGLLAYPLRPFALNCEAAIAFHRLAAIEPESEFDDVARAALASVAGAAAAEGPLGAYYLLALRALSR